MTQAAPSSLPAGVALRRDLDADGHTLRVIAWTPDGADLLGIASNGTAWLWDAVTGELRWRVKPGLGGPSYAAWSPDGRYWAVGTHQGQLHLCGASDGTLHTSHRAFDAGVVGMGWSDDGDTVRVFSGNRHLARWPVYPGNSLHDLALEAEGGVARCAAWSPDSLSVAIASATGRVECRGVLDSRLKWAVRWEGIGSANSVVWSADGQQLAAAYEGQQVRVWRHDDAQALWSEEQGAGAPWNSQATVQPPAQVLGELASGASWTSFSADARFLAARTRSDVLHLWRCDTWTEVAAIEGESAQGSAGPLVAFHPRDPLLAAVRADGTGILILALDIDVLLR